MLRIHSLPDSYSDWHLITHSKKKHGLLKNGVARKNTKTKQSTCSTFFERQLSTFLAELESRNCQFVLVFLRQHLISGENGNSFLKTYRYH